MANVPTVEHTPRKPLRLWPGIVAAIALVLGNFLLPVFFTGSPVFRLFGGAIGGLAIILWWLFFSRAAWSERLGAVAVMIGALFATRPFLHRSVAGVGPGTEFLFFFLAVPFIGLALVAWAAATRGLSNRVRRGSMVIVILLACGSFTLLRNGGITGDGDLDLRWRWAKTAEDRVLAQSHDEPAPRQPVETADATVVASPAAVAKTVPADPIDQRRAEWPGFRGPARDGIIRGVQIETDWSKSPPTEMWRRPIGPGWSSFAVRGDLLYTQEQRGQDEVTSCYRVSSGEPVWRHRDAGRFYESGAGTGPRATPTVHSGRVYTVGATGILNALDAINGSVFWSRNALTDTGRKVPEYGLSSSPLAVDDLVIVAVSGQLIAYDARTGNPRWTGQPGGGGYSSPHFATIDGVPQVLQVRGSRTISVAPADGTLLWEHTWEPGVAIVQPAVIADGLLISLADLLGGVGIRRIAVTRGAAGWKVEERWTSRGLKSYYNDFVVHNGHAFGFDGGILACVDLANGERKWKGGRYGHGQIVLLPDQDVLLVLSEEGELALVKATPDQFTEVARFKAIEGKTWNHPVVVRDVVLVRNGEEMAAFRLPGLAR